MPACEKSTTDMEYLETSTTDLKNLETSPTEPKDVKTCTTDLTDLERPQCFPCAFEGCKRIFKRKDRLEIHSRTHTGERPFVCSIGECKKSYARSQHLKRHIESSHTPKDEGSLNEKFSCPFCKRELANVYSLQKHVKRQHKEDNEAKPYKCPELGCLESFHKKKQLVNHKLKEHTGHLLDARKCHRCPHEGCNKVFVWNKLLKRHMKVHQGYPCDAHGCCQVFPNWSTLRKHKAQDHKPAFVCEQCGISFSRRPNLTQHIRRKHEGPRQTFTCPVEQCGLVYSYISNLKMHIRESHEGEEIWKGRERKRKPVTKREKVPLKKRSLAAKLCGLDDSGERPPVKKAALSTSGVSSFSHSQDQTAEEDTSSQNLVTSDKTMPSLMGVCEDHTIISSTPGFHMTEPMSVEYQTDLLQSDAVCDQDYTELSLLIKHKDRVEQTTVLLKKAVTDLRDERSY